MDMIFDKFQNIEPVNPFSQLQLEQDLIGTIYDKTILIAHKSKITAIKSYIETYNRILNPYNKKMWLIEEVKILTSNLFLGICKWFLNKLNLVNQTYS